MNSQAKLLLIITLALGATISIVWQLHENSSEISPLNAIDIKSGAELDEKLATAEKPSIVQFHSSCPVCKKTGLIIEKAAENNPAFNYFTVDINKIDELAQRYEIAALPTVIFFAPGSTTPFIKMTDITQEKLEEAFSDIKSKI